MNKTSGSQRLIGILWLGMMSSSAESLPASPKKSGNRPKFQSKIHIPVQQAREVTPLPPTGYQLVFSDEFDGVSVDTNRWGFRLESKMLSTQQRENVSVKVGNLVIALRKESARGKDYTAGGVISRQTFVYRFHVWSCEFIPDIIRFYLDGRLTQALSSSGFPHDEMNVWFSVIASTMRGGPVGGRIEAAQRGAVRLHPRSSTSEVSGSGGGRARRGPAPPAAAREQEYRGHRGEA